MTTNGRQALSVRYIGLDFIVVLGEWLLLTFVASCGCAQRSV